MTKSPKQLAESAISAQRATGSVISKALVNLTKLGEDSITIDVLQHRLSQLENYWSAFYEKHLKIYDCRDELKDDDYFTQDYFTTVEDTFLNTKVEFCSRLSAKLGQLRQNMQLPVNDAIGGHTLAVATTASSLPKLTLPRFSGKQEDWDSFKERFSSMVKDSHTLTPVLKLQHLLSCLDGEAERRLGNIQVVGANFDVAWKALEDRYDNKRLRLAVQLTRLLSMQPAARKSVAEITRLMDTTNESIRALRSLGRPVDSWDDWFVQLVVFNLDTDTREDWEKSLEGKQTFPTYDTLTRFLENRTKSLDTAHCSDSTLAPVKSKSQGGSSRRQTHVKSVSAHLSNESTAKKKLPVCVVCQASHYVGYCPELLQKAPSQRHELAGQLRLCYNCLRTGHVTSSCPSKSRCKHCRQDHHSILHQFDSNQSTPAGEFMPPGPRPGLSKVGSNLTSSHSTYLGRTTLLGTARVVLQSKAGNTFEFRALIDPCSEGSFISEKAAQALLLSRTPCMTSVTGVGGQVSATATSTTFLSLRSRTDYSFCLTFSAVILPRLSALLPSQPVQLADLDYLQGLEMADPGFHQPGHVDCILGGDLYPSIILEGLRRGKSGSPVAQSTRLGWILTGPTTDTRISSHLTLRCFNTGVTTSEQLRRFWEIEEITSEPALTPDEEECERHFTTTHTRDERGRYIVRLPFKLTPSLPGSRSSAVNRLLSLERRLTKDNNLQRAYSKFLGDYEALGHMARVKPQAIDLSCYLPHHPVITSKLRVVFGGEALNEFLHPGPKLQRDITTILTRWRVHRYVFTADIVKMFRQIRIHDDDVRWQRIVWRASPDLPIEDYDLLTVTYGTACAPYLAIRVLLQLADDEEDTFPLGARILRENMYVDDALAGADTLEEALAARLQLQKILSEAGMQLDKWAANHSSLVSDVTKATADLNLDAENIVSTLGLRWSPSEDVFRYRVQTVNAAPVPTKRTMLGEIARLYDPLGFLAPVIISAKIILQQLWLTGQNWDDPVDQVTQKLWEDLKTQLSDLESIKIPRWLGSTCCTSYALHGFSDASEKAYAAAVYFVHTDSKGKCHAALIAAKSKVAPIKTVSIPRLELCGALILARLVRRIQADLGTQSAPVFCWTDSQVVLAWLKGRPNQWKTFVANRVSEILTTLPTAQWNHVRSALNPADHATRGLTPRQLQEADLWWKGPATLFRDPDKATEKIDYATSIEKRISTATHQASTTSEHIESFLLRFSSFRRMLRVSCYIFRWKAHYRLSAANRSPTTISAEELNLARSRLIIAVQAQHFQRELAQLSKGKSVHLSSPLRRFVPFLDQDGLLRLGGRLEFSYLSADEKHPIIIPRTSHLADLLIQDAHLATLHGGPQLCQSHLLRRYWIPQLRNKVRMICRKCIRCLRFQGRTFSQQMAPLPAARVAPARPFAITGVDYAGPFAVRTSKGRGQRSSKGYVAVFTCFVTRAVHLEIVSDYSSKTFLLAFKRFVARRGLCHQVFSDNGTTFQGADSELRRCFQEASSFSHEVAEAVQADGITWSFIPPRAPHFGGLWEAAVKAFKHHFKRVIGDSKLTFEEFTTVAASIEACLNSRPLSPISSDPSDVSALTPGHFLVGTALTAPPEPPSSGSVVSGLPRWKITTQMHHHFWRRWRKEVLHQMQQRSKWLDPGSSPAAGDLVLLTDDLLPPQKWPLARIVALHPGPDGLPRVATLRTTTTQLQRPLTRVIVLPVNEAASAHYAAFCLSSTNN